MLIFACMKGGMEKGTHGMSNKSRHKELLLHAEHKQRDAMKKDRDAEENDRAAI